MRTPSRQTTEEKFRLISHILTATFALTYLLLLLLAYISCHAYQDSYRLLLRILLFSAIPFLAVTALRYLIALPRPSRADGEVQKKSYSFPSRHTYSAFFIATLTFLFGGSAIYVLYPMAILLAVARVLAGLHYPRDVVAGAGLGVIFGILAILLI